MKIQVSLTSKKFALCHFNFKKDLYQSVFLLTKRNPKTIFFYEEKVKKISHSAFVLQ